MRWSELLHDGRILFALPGFLAAGLLVPSTSPRAPAPTTKNEISIYPAQRGCFTTSMDAPDITEVRQLVAELQRDGSDRAPTARLRMMLAERYGSLVTETATPMFYTWIWDEVHQIWLRVCDSQSVFEVDFGALGAIVVESRDTQYSNGHPE